MKRQRRKQPGKTRKAAQNAATAAAAPASTMTRRDWLAWAKFGALGAAVVGGGGWYMVSSVQAHIRETDLTKIGNGVPTIVQVHDPACPDCRALQNAAREALENFEDGEVQYLVAELASPEGRTLAQTHGVGRVTLLLFDRRGRVREVLQGRRSPEVLTSEFQRLLRISGKARPAAGS
ncbi:MAG: hypothetical protein AAFV19_17265 [Pseudomonadota bacterium]